MIFVYVILLQHDVCRALEEQDGDKKFLVDKWMRKEVHQLIYMFSWGGYMYMSSRYDL